MSREIKKIKKYEKYYISDKGEVFCNNYRGTGTWKKLKLFKTSTGYDTVSLYKDNKESLRYVHQLVLETFKPNAKKGLDKEQQLQIRHLNGIKDDNRLENLKRGTAKENGADSKRNDNNQPRGSQVCTSKLDERKVKKIRSFLMKENLLQKEIAEIFNITPSTISSINRGKTWGWLN